VYKKPGTKQIDPNAGQGWQGIFRHNVLVSCPLFILFLPDLQPLRMNPDNALEIRYESLKYKKSAPYFQEA
jgi:hypothetical protein